MANPAGQEKVPSKPLEVEDIFAGQEQKPQPSPDVRERQPETAPEAAPEVQKERTETKKESEDAQRKYAPPPAQTPPTTQAPVEKSEELVKIEGILSEHLDDLFIQMTPEQQMTFQQKGEETAGKIETLMQDVKIKVKEVLGLLRDWLKIIPGVNKFFIEQEAKIKADRILNLHEQKQKQK